MPDDLVRSVRQWLEKAESDWASVRILSRESACPCDSVCFHCQQFVEKVLKGLLTLHEVEFPKTHDLRRLIQLASPHCPDLESILDLSDQLTGYGVESRYPDSFRLIRQEEMQQAIAAADQIGRMIIPLLHYAVNENDALEELP
jgi:HEPN domain-containing protein